MSVKVTSLSVGSLIREILAEDEDVRSITERVFPVVTDKADLPYVFYRVSSFKHDPTKGMQGADVVGVEVVCCAETYAECVNLAEAVRGALDYQAWENDEGTLRLRSCNLTGYDQQWADDAHIGTLTFTLRV